MENKAVKFGHFIKSMPFEVWMRYFFKVVEGVDFIREPYHDDVFDTFQAIYEQNEDYRYTNLNLAPRSGKTISATYFMAYCIVNNPKCEFIYTSFSTAVLRDVNIGLMKIFDNPLFKAMYQLDSYSKDIDANVPSDWVEIYQKYSEDYKKDKKIASAKLITIADSKIHLQPVGSTITGLGFGVRNSEKFSGMLLMDDIQKIQDIKNSELLRQKTNDYFSSVLASRANNPKAPILNIQQRICLGDMTSNLEDEYDFKTVKAPLFINGFCQLPSQYDDKRIKLIQRSEFDFQAQYQQNPINAGGNLFKEEWLDWSDDIPALDKYEWIYFVGDTAFSDKQTADYSVLSTFGVLDKKLYLIDVFRKKVDSIDLPKVIDDICVKYKIYQMDYTWLEPKASGTTIIQALRKYSNNVKIPSDDDIKKHMKRIVNKVERANDCMGWIDKDNKNVIINKRIDNFEEIKSELLNFPTAVNDDFVDTFVDGVNLFGKYYNNRKANYAMALDIRREMGF